MPVPYVNPEYMARWLKARPPTPVLAAWGGDLDPDYVPQGASGGRTNVEVYVRAPTPEYMAKTAPNGVLRVPDDFARAAIVGSPILTETASSDEDEESGAGASGWATLDEDSDMADQDDDDEEEVDELQEEEPVACAALSEQEQERFNARLRPYTPPMQHTQYRQKAENLPAQTDSRGAGKLDCFLGKFRVVPVT